jgi:hypothetical protein
MSPFVAMALVGLAAGLMIPVTAIMAAKLGISDPFALDLMGWKWTFSKHRHVIATVVNVFVGVERRR